MFIPESVREAARNAALSTYLEHKTTGPVLCKAIADAVIYAIEDHPEMQPNHTPKRPDENVVQMNVFEKKDPPRYFQ